jgi:hypothetical protein
MEILFWNIGELGSAGGIDSSRLLVNCIFQFSDRELNSLCQGNCGGAVG